jgi:hypothetical protein
VTPLTKATMRLRVPSIRVSVLQGFTWSAAIAIEGNRQIGIRTYGLIEGESLLAVLP